MLKLPVSGPRFWLGVLFMCCVPATMSPVYAQNPTEAQLEIFRGLSSQDQRAVLESLESGDADLGSDSAGVDGAPVDFLRDRLRNRERQGDRRLGVNERGEPRFKAQDTLLFLLEIKEFKDQNQNRPPQLPNQQTTAPLLPTPGTVGPASVLAPNATPVERERIARTDAETQRLEELRTRILRRNPFIIDKWGILSIPELGPIPLAGLTAEEARQRLAAEPLLADFVVTVTYLPVDPVGALALKPFGYDLFETTPSTFAPATNIPVPPEYVIGPGDRFEVQLTGTTSGRSTMTVQRDGTVNFPELGPIAVAGMRFDEAKALLERRAGEQLIGTQASVQMGQLRSIQIWLAGDAVQPGAYTVSALSTITNALFVSGGVKEIGSLRNIELRRSGQTVTRFDLYDLLLRGDARADLRLVAGDVIFIPTIGRVVGIAGEAQRPALYELKAENTAADLIRLAGGLTAEADQQLATLDRIDPQQRRIVLDINLSTAAANTVLANGDILNVPTIRPTVDDAVQLVGHVHRAGKVQYRSGLRISDVIPSLEELKATADQHYVLVRREVGPTRRVEFISADLVQALAQRGGAADLPLTQRDQVYVFDLETGRDRLLDPLLREARLQSSRDAPTAEVSISGRVNVPGRYPLEAGMRVRDLIRAGGSLNEAAYGGKAELTRNAIGSGEERKTELIEIDLTRAMAGDPQANLELQPFDYLIIKELPLWGAQEYVEVQGEVRFPGRYPIQRGETLRSVVQRAGGVTQLAFSQGTVFTRETLKERERKQLAELGRRLQTDLAQVSLMAAQEGRDAGQALAVGKQLLDSLGEAEAVGRLVINLDNATVARPGSAQDIVLKDGDQLLVPRVTQEITVIGEVQSPTSHLFDEKLSRSDYIRMSGGMTQRADESRIYVVRADGSVVGGNGNRWFGGESVDIKPGDTVVVPLDADRVRALPLWAAISQIIYQLAVAVLAVESASN
jgi:polysaccharide biosynthesis/export protein